MKKQTSIRNWEITRDVAAVVGALTSITVVWAIVYNNVLQVFPSPWIAGAFALAAIAGVLFVIDWGLRADLGYAFDLLISGKAWTNWRLAAFLILLLGFNVARSFTTITLSWQGRKDVITSVVKPPELENVAAAKSALDNASAARLAGLERNIRELQAQIKSAEAGAGSAALRSLAASGNGWARGELARARAKASKEYRAQLATAQSAYTNILQTDAATGAAAVNALARVNEERAATYHDITSRNMAYLGYFGAGCTFVVILVSLMLSLINVAEQELPRYNFRTAVNSMPPNVAPVRGPEWGDRKVDILMAKVNRLEGDKLSPATGVKKESTGVQFVPPAGGEKLEGVKRVQKAVKLSPRGENYKGSARDKLRRKIARYKRLAAADQLGEKGRKTLEQMQSDYAKMKGTK
jgi:hypothetical protein